MTRRTPPIGISGAFLLRTPFAVDAGKSYTVTAIRQYVELIGRGQDPVALIYTPVNLGMEEYLHDKEAGALVICLQDKEGRLTYVPDTWIDAYPNMGSIAYSHLVLGVSLGMWPDYRDTQDIQDLIAQAVEAGVGVTPQIVETRAATTDFVSEQQHTQLTAARQTAITNRETSHATILRLSEEVQRLNAIVDEQAMIIEGLLE